LGLQGLSNPDVGPAIRALASYANAHGGLGGRKLIPIYRFDDGSGSWSANYQAACEALTEDNHVFAVVSSVTAPQTEEFASCLAAHKTLFSFNNRIVWDRKIFDRLSPHAYGQSYLDGTRWDAIVDGFVRNGFLIASRESASSGKRSARPSGFSRASSSRGSPSTA
jgi:hypothetical protein